MQGQFYSIKVRFSNKHTLTFLDSLKLIPFAVSEIPKKFNIDCIKGEIDYNKYRPLGYVPDEAEWDYIKRDVKIVAQALRIFLDNNYSKMTIGSNAITDYKTNYGVDFKNFFPNVDDIDSDIRLAYKGGFVFVNPKYRGVDLNEGIVLDVNSLYPDVMYHCLLPYGRPVYFNGKYMKDEIYSLYIQHFRCCFRLKEGYLPTIQLKNAFFRNSIEYVESSEGLEVDLCLTSVDMELFFSHYDVWDITYINGFKFKASADLFKKYIDYWMKVKVENNKNIGMRTLAKLMLNNLYGKFAQNPNTHSKCPVYDNIEDKITYELSELEKREGIYIPVGCFVTAWARYKTISAAQRNFDRFIYADTDSLHLIGNELPCLEINETKLGAWKLEARFTKARFLRAKTYAEEIDGSLHITAAGMPKSCYPYVTWDNFIYDSEIIGKLKSKRVSGGVVLLESPHKIKR